MIPVVNVICVIALAHFGATGGPTTLRGIGLQLARNPYIWACALGGLLNALHVPVPKVMMEFGDILGRASLAVGLLVVGGGLALRELKQVKPPVFAASFLKLLAKPAVAVATGLPLGLSGVELQVVAICAAVPSAPAAYVLARQMGGDAPLMAEILTWQILFAAFTLPLVVALVQMLG